MSIPDGAEYWWDIRGYGSCYKPSTRKALTPEQKRKKEKRRQARLACLCQMCGHTLQKHGRHRVAPGALGKRRHGGWCNDPDCGCDQFVPYKADQEVLTPFYEKPLNPVLHRLMNPDRRGD